LSFPVSVTVGERRRFAPKRTSSTKIITMRTTLQAFATVAAPALLCVLAIRGAYSMVRGEIVAPGLLITTALGAIVCGVWSRTARTRAANLRHSIAAEELRSRAALRLRDALIGEGREAVVAWDSAGGEPLSFGGGSDLLASCLSGAEGDEVSAALARLKKASPSRSP
jgi:hypothetical protein